MSMSKPTKTANGLFKYDEIIKGKKLSDWVQELNKYNSIKNGWRVSHLNEGCFGFDNLATCFGIVMKLINKEDLSSLSLTLPLPLPLTLPLTLTNIAEKIHDAWIINYIYWRDNIKTIPSNYTKPAKPLNDERRNNCAKLKFSDLPDDEKEKDLILAQFFLDIMKND